MIEDHFPSGRPAWEKLGGAVLLVKGEDVKMCETRVIVICSSTTMCIKVRIILIELLVRGENVTTCNAIVRLASPSTPSQLCVDEASGAQYTSLYTLCTGMSR